MYTLKMKAASVEVFPFVQCGLVAPLVVDGYTDSKSSCSVGDGPGLSSGSGGFICICSEEMVVVLCGSRIGGHCGWCWVGERTADSVVPLLAVRGLMTGGWPHLLLGL